MGQSQALNPFDFNGTNIRVIDMDGEPWFPAKEVCDLLGLMIPNNAVKDHCNPADAKALKKSEISKPRSASISFPNRGMTCTTETGVYKLVVLSRKPGAEAEAHYRTTTKSAVSNVHGVDFSYPNHGMLCD